MEKESTWKKYCSIIDGRYSNNAVLLLLEGSFPQSALVCLKVQAAKNRWIIFGVCEDKWKGKALGSKGAELKAQRHWLIPISSKSVWTDSWESILFFKIEGRGHS